MKLKRIFLQGDEKGPFYKYGLVAGLVAPSYKVVGKTLKKSIVRLTSIGISVVYYTPLRTKLKWSGSAMDRAKQINQMFVDDQVNIVWAMRGGLASLGIIPHLDIESIKQHKKLFIGYSDITSLQIVLWEKAGLATLQYYMPGSKNWFSKQGDFDFFYHILHGDVFSESLVEEQIFNEGKTEGKIVGGCLDLICSSLGTNYELNTDDKILYLEDANIPPQRLLNDLYHLRNAGKFDSIRGLIIARIHNCKNYESYLQVFLEEMGFQIPVVIEFESGHTARKVPIPVGGEAFLDTFSRSIRFSLKQY